MLTALFAALTVVFAQIIIPLPFSPVPFSMGIMAVLLSGMILDRAYAAGAQLVYILLGLVGIPVFGGFSGGPSVLFGMTGGYIIAYPIMAFLVASIPKWMHKRSFFTYLLGMIAALFVCYLLGSLWFMVVAKTSWWQSILTGVAPFVIFDCIKAVLCIMLGMALRKALQAAKVL